VVCLYGNHEDWLLQALRDPTAHAWLLGMDGFTTIRSYSTEAEDALRDAVAAAAGAVYDGTVALPYQVFFDAMPAAHRQFLEGLVSHHSDDQGSCTDIAITPSSTSTAGRIHARSDEPLASIRAGTASSVPSACRICACFKAPASGTAPDVPGLSGSVLVSSCRWATRGCVGFSWLACPA